MKIEDVDLANIDPCPGCGTPTRRMGGVPIAGSGLDLVFATVAWCDPCLQAKCDAAMEGITSPHIDRFNEAPRPIETGVSL